MFYLSRFSSYLAGFKKRFDNGCSLVLLIPRPTFKTFPLPVWGLGGNVGVRGLPHSIANPWIHISSLLTHMVYLLPFLGKTPYGVLPLCDDRRTPVSLLSSLSSLFVQSEAVVYLENGLT